MTVLDELKPGWNAADIARATQRALRSAISRGDIRFTTGMFPASGLSNTFFDFDDQWNTYQAMRGYNRTRSR